MTRFKGLNGFRTQPDPRSSDARRCSFEVLEGRYLLAADFGDAPDSGLGASAGNYQTLLSDNGPSHTIVAGLHFGANVDDDSGTLQNAAANADDVNGALPVDEDGLSNPAADLKLTVGAAPTVSVHVTNTTGTAATLYGWIDYDADGVFENSTERASVVVPSGANTVLTTLTFPTVSGGHTGATYARFRLSTDVAAADSTGIAADGEVEDYRAMIASRAIGQANSAKTKTIAGNRGDSIVAIGDLDSDGVIDIAVGDTDDETGGEFDRGAVNVHFMNADGTVKSGQKIAHNTGGGPALEYFDSFGSALAALGDLDGDGVPDLAVGARYGDDGKGSVFVLFMNSDGTAKNYQKIASGVGGGPLVDEWTSFGGALASLGDMDGDGVTDIAVGASTDSDEEHNSGAVHVLFLNADGTVKQSQKIASEVGGGPTLERRDNFGVSLASLGDIDGDGVNDLAVGAYNDFENESFHDYSGIVHVLLMNANGTVKQSQKIGDGKGGGPPLSEYDNFGHAIASLGDLDGDGITDIAVGAPSFGGGETYDGGAVYVLLLKADGTAKTRWRIGDNTNGGPQLDDYSSFGSAIASLGDLDGDGLIDLAVQTRGGGEESSETQPALHFLLLQPFTPDYGDAPDVAAGCSPGNYQTRSDDGGPSHAIVHGLRLGASVDSDSGTLTNAAANADNANGTMPGDEDGLVNPVADLQLTIGSVPTISMWVTNTTGSAATVYGWIDYNADGIFDDATERASAAVADGTSSEIVTLTFPNVPDSYTGTTYARFRLSTDLAAASPSGVAIDGEVEDYRVQITAPSSGTADITKTKKIARNMNGGPTSSIGRFGGSAASVGDLDGDGVTDLVVCAGSQLYTVFLNSDGSAKLSQIIDSAYGDVVTPLGDLDGDGITDVAVKNRQGVAVLHLNADGTVKRSQQVATDFNPMSLAGIGDIDGDGVGDLAVGVETEDGFGDSYAGAVFVLQLNSNGSVKAVEVISDEIGGGPQLAEGDLFGSAVAPLGDIDGDGITDLAVSAIGDNTGTDDSDTSKGALYIVFMNADGTAKSTQKIAHETGGGPTLADNTSFGGSMAALGDLDGDGVTDIAVGAIYDDTGGEGRGAIHVLYLHSDGTAKSSHMIANQIGGGPALTNFDKFGFSITSLGDLDGDGVTDITVGATGDDTGGSSSGALYMMFLTPPPFRGDYNLDNVVDAGDQLLWRKTLNATVPAYSGADGSGNGVVDQADFDVWRANFGKTRPISGSGNTLIQAANNLPLTMPQQSTFAESATPPAEPFVAAMFMDAELTTESLSTVATTVRTTAPPTAAVALSSIYMPTMASATAPKTDEFILGPRGEFQTAASRQQAILTCLLSKPSESAQKWDSALSEDLTNEFHVGRSPNRLIDTIDLAFASLTVWRS